MQSSVLTRILCIKTQNVDTLNWGHIRVSRIKVQSADTFKSGDIRILLNRGTYIRVFRIRVQSANTRTGDIYKSISHQAREGI